MSGLGVRGNLTYWDILWMGIDADYRGVWLEIGTVEYIQSVVALPYSWVE